jgi:hypothetical protein
VNLIAGLIAYTHQPKKPSITSGFPTNFGASLPVVI